MEGLSLHTQNSRSKPLAPKLNATIRVTRPICAPHLPNPLFALSGALFPGEGFPGLGSPAEQSSFQGFGRKPPRSGGRNGGGFDRLSSNPSSRVNAVIGGIAGIETSQGLADNLAGGIGPYFSGIYGQVVK